jgi:catechol 2,3-dioxygenase-like lactoylglutathione lyase family enzyme
LFCVEILTDHWDRLVQWYREALGMKVLVRVVDDRYALLEAGGTRVAIVGRELNDTAGDGKRPAKKTTDWSLVFEVEDLTAADARLRDLGLRGTSRAMHEEGFAELTVNDPDGNCVRLIAWPESE